MGAAMKQLLFVGEANPYGARPEFALYHLPRNASGNRLREHLGLTDNQYLKLFDRVNLLDEPKWSAPRARAAAVTLLAARPAGSALVLLGTRVAPAFLVPKTPCQRYERDGRLLLVLPHPSGLCHVWDEDGVEARARALFAEVCAAVGIQSALEAAERR
jgi:hypothetical protein